MVETFTSSTPTNFNSVSSYCRQFQMTIFLSQATIAADIFHKLVDPVHIFLFLRACNSFNVT